MESAVKIHRVTEDIPQQGTNLVYNSKILFFSKKRKISKYSTFIF